MRGMRSPFGISTSLLSLLSVGVVAACGGPDSAQSPSGQTTNGQTANAASSSSANAVGLPAKGATASAPIPFSYEAPEKWGELTPDYALCKSGEHQTPIDLPASGDVSKSTASLVFAYEKQPLSILNNGHTVQVMSTAKATLTAGPRTWKLAQFHFHVPSEHTIAGKRFDAELHLVHKNDKGELAVVGILLQKGNADTALAPVFDHAPPSPPSSAPSAAREAKSIDGAIVDLSPVLQSAFFGSNNAYYTYSGSLTIPPCSENVTWLIAATPDQISEAQLNALTSAIGEKNARPIQPRNARDVGIFRAASK